MANPTLRALASMINQAGGGIPFERGGVLAKFQSGGILSAPLPAPTIASNNGATDVMSQFLNSQAETNKAINSRIDRLTVINDLSNQQEIEENESNLNTLTTF